MREIKSMLQFAGAFDSKQKCLAHLSNLKWQNGFVCKRCGNKESSKGRNSYYRRCKLCRYDESCTAHTLFHNVKFALPKAFMIVHQVSTMKKGLSSCEISRQFRIHQTTAWYFKVKIQQAMKESNLIEFAGEGKKEKVAKGNELDQLISRSIPGQIILEKKQKQDAKKIDVKMEIQQANASGSVTYSILSVEKSGKPIKNRSGFNRVMWTDGIEYASKDRTRKFEIDFIPGTGGNNVVVRWYIFNLRNWMRGIHHHISLAHLQSYMGEYQYRHNHRATARDNPFKVLLLMMSLPWLPYSEAIAK